MEPLRIPERPSLLPPNLPEPLNLPAPILELPKAEVPSYTPLNFPFSTETFSNGVRVNTKGEQADDQDKKPAAASMPAIVVPIPALQVPQYQTHGQTPSVLPALQDRPQLAEATTITLPGTDIQIPVPRAEIVSAAAVTSVISVAATLTATSLFKRLVSLFKPVISALLKKIDKLQNKKTISFGRQRYLSRRHRQLHKVKKDGSYILPS